MNRRLTTEQELERSHAAFKYQKKLWQAASDQSHQRGEAIKELVGRVIKLEKQNASLKQRLSVLQSQR